MLKFLVLKNSRKPIKKYQKKPKNYKKQSIDFVLLKLN